MAVNSDNRYQPLPNDVFLTVAEVAALLKVREETVRTWLRRAQLRGFGLGGRAGWRVRQSDIERFLSERLHEQPV